MTLKWGIIGAGKISYNFVAAVETLPTTDHQVVAVAGKNKQNVDNFGDEFGIAKRYYEYEDIVKDPDVDVIYIGNLVPQHFETAKLALENDKAVLCEKPCCINAKQTSRLVEIARKRNLFFMEAVWTRFFPAFKQMLQEIDAGTIGDVHYVSASFGWNWEGDSRVKVKDLGGGAIIDIGVYTLQTQQAIFRGLKPVKIIANGHLNQDGVDETTGIVIRYPDSKLAVLSCSSNVPLAGETLVIGTKGSIKLPQMWSPTKIIINDQIKEYPLKETKRNVYYMNATGMAYEAEEVRICIKAGQIESSIMPHQETIELAKLMDTVREQVGMIYPEDSQEFGSDSNNDVKYSLNADYHSYRESRSSPKIHKMALKWGIMGAGKISFDFVAAVRTLPVENHQVIAVAGRNKINVEKFANELAIPKWYDDYQKLAEDSDVDIIYIGNLNPQHFNSAKMCLEHNKHVLCEKPCTMNEKQTSRLIQIAKERNLFFMEAVWSRCFPAYRKMEDIIASGAIGDVSYITATFGKPLQHVQRLKSMELGGGAILDLGVYVLQLQQFVFRGLKPVKIVANGQLNEDGVDESCGAVLTYPEGKIAVVSVSAKVDLPNEAIIVGTKGTLKLPTMWCPPKLEAPDQTYEWELPKSDVEFKYENGSGLAYEVEEVGRCIKAGKIESSRITHEETIQLARYMDFLRKEVGVVFPEDSKEY